MGRGAAVCVSSWEVCKIKCVCPIHLQYVRKRSVLYHWVGLIGLACVSLVRSDRCVGGCGECVLDLSLVEMCYGGKERLGSKKMGSNGSAGDERPGASVEHSCDCVD